MNAPGWPAAFCDNPCLKVDGVRRAISRGERQALLQNTYGDSIHAVSLFLTRLDDPLPGGVVATHADIDAPLVGELSVASNGGLEPAVLFDFVNGLELTVPSGNITLSVTYPATLLAAGGPSLNLQQQVGAIVTCSNRPPASGGLSQARLTTRLGDVLAAASIVVPVPVRAHAVRLLVSRPNLYGSFRVGFSPAIAAGRELYFLDPTEEDEMPLTAGTRAITVTNNSALTTMITLLWSLSL